MKRHYYLSDNLDGLDRIEDELEHHGIVRPRIHVLSKDDSGVKTHRHLHNIESVLKQDVVYGTILGGLYGMLAAVLVMLTGMPRWIVMGQQTFKDFTNTTFP